MTAWNNFNKKAGNNDAVGIYHETYDLKNEQYESVYANMPLYGLGKAKPHVPITAERISARKRLNSNSI